MGHQSDSVGSLPWWPPIDDLYCRKLLERGLQDPKSFFVSKQFNFVTICNSDFCFRYRTRCVFNISVFTILFRRAIIGWSSGSFGLFNSAAFISKFLPFKVDQIASSRIRVYSLVFQFRKGSFGDQMDYIFFRKHVPLVL